MTMSKPAKERRRATGTNDAGCRIVIESDGTTRSSFENAAHLERVVGFARVADEAHDEAGQAEQQAREEVQQQHRVLRGRVVAERERQAVRQRGHGRAIREQQQGRREQWFGPDELVHAEQRKERERQAGRQQVRDSVPQRGRHPVAHQRHAAQNLRRSTNGRVKPATAFVSLQAER